MQSIIESAWENRDLLKESATIKAIETVIEQLDKGLLRVAEPTSDGLWIVNAATIFLGSTINYVP